MELCRFGDGAPPSSSSSSSSSPASGCSFFRPTSPSHTSKMKGISTTKLSPSGTGHTKCSAVSSLRPAVSRDKISSASRGLAGTLRVSVAAQHFPTSVDEQLATVDPPADFGNTYSPPVPFGTFKWMTTVAGCTAVKLSGASSGAPAHGAASTCRPSWPPRWSRRNIIAEGGAGGNRASCRARASSFARSSSIMTRSAGSSASSTSSPSSKTSSLSCSMAKASKYFRSSSVTKPSARYSLGSSSDNLRTPGFAGASGGAGPSKRGSRPSPTEYFIRL
mmetsp:Transcript_110789/g.309623  ORF Transcript_110789/g.309623 Transcript_110789/m.309623 type:complete len:277 (-) Transcript_110789:185-1015(-)